MFSRLRSLWRAARDRSAFERGMDEELRFHLEQRADDLVRGGLTREAAKRRARVEFGNPEAYQDRCRDSKQLHVIDDVRQDVRYALRGLWREPALSVGMIATLTLSIGATTALFSVVHSVLLRPLPYPDPDRLVVMGNQNKTGRLVNVFGPDYIAWRDRCASCEHVAASSATSPANIAGGSEAERVIVSHVTPNFFATMGVSPMLGRTFLPHETGRPFLGGGNAASTPVTAIVLGHAFWQRRFAGDPSIVGRMVNIDGDHCPVVGVMPPGFAFPNAAEAWVPAVVNSKRDNAFLQIYARLKPGARPEQAAAEAEVESRRLDGPADDGDPTIVRARPLHEFLVGDYRSSLLMFLGAIGFVLLIACANVANLQLARAAARPREFAIRASLGAGRNRLAKQLLTESLLLATIGSVLGLLTAVFLVRAFVRLAPADIPRLSTISVDGSALGFTLLLSLVCGVLFGFAPMLHASKADPIGWLQPGGQRITIGAAAKRLRMGLVAAEVALAMVLLIGGGLLLKSFVLLHRTSTGFDPTSVLTASITLPRATYPTSVNAGAFYDRALAGLSNIAGVEAAGVVSAPPLGRTGVRVSGSLRVDGETADRPNVIARKMSASGGYFRALGIPVRQGRVFDERDTAASARVIVVSDTLARTLWGSANPLGKRINIGFRGETWREVVGVVGDIKHDMLALTSPPAFYIPHTQVAESIRWMVGDMGFVVRTASRPESVAAPLRTTLAHVDPTLPVHTVALMTDVVSRNIAGPRFYAILLGSFSLLAALLAAAGVYGVVAYSVGQRTHEIGLRMALGATLGTVRRQVLREGMMPVIAGCVAGLAGAWLLTDLLSRFMYQVTGRDPWTFAVMPLGLAAIALTACAIPARRASRIDPMVALRDE
jgi:putative ABC transport system permease protein